jgi:GTP-binding protein EngB required for normal cell division
MLPNRRTAGTSNAEHAVEFASELARRYELSSLAPLLASCHSAISQNEVSVAVVGRFKAGKSSFLNHFINRSVLPVGVVPVTTVITEIRFGPAERAEVCFQDGRVQEVPLKGISAYVSERENPENHKGVKLITIELPGLEPFRGLKFVDTPGLESALAHNTEEALRWLPNVGLALVAVSVDPPLSHQDIELLKKLYRFTPNVTVLLTKVDLLAAEERAEVVAFVTGQLAKTFEKAPQVAPYSVRPGFEGLKDSLERTVFYPVLESFSKERASILDRKAGTLLLECSDYVTLSLKSAELAGAQRQALHKQLIAKEQVISDVKAQLRLIARDAVGNTRAFTDRLLQAHQKPLEDWLLNGLAAEYPQWTRSLAALIDSFDQWLGSALRESLAMVSAAERSRISEPLQRTAKQIFRILQDFRDRLSDGTMKAFGVPLRTTEVILEVQEPESPDIHVGKIFDRSWELLSPIVPVALVSGIVRRHFERQVSYKLHVNISRLVSQWEERTNFALLNMEKEAERRLDEFVATVARLVETSEPDRLPTIREDLEKIGTLRAALADPAAQEGSNG